MLSNRSGARAATIAQYVPKRFASNSEPEAQRLKEQLRPSRVPSSQVERLLHYGGLATTLGAGALSEGLKRFVGGKPSGGKSAFLSEANLERMVRKLSQMRGAALKIGQLISFQDEKVIPKEIHTVLARLQSRANYMPPKQLERVLSGDLGSSWRNLFTEFEEMPFAAASIGQVHRATLRQSNQPVAVKVQYPGVANSIDSDLNTLSLLLLGTSMLPEGMFLDKTIENARTELAWECDYTREANNIKKFQQLLSDESSYAVPDVIDEASGVHVLTMEFMSGIELNEIIKEPQDVRNDIATRVMRLCLLEIARFKFMQTDPNWANFLWNRSSSQLALLDFGASRGYDDAFIINYTAILKAAVAKDNQQIKIISEKLGYLTGLESKAMVDAHIDSILVLGEPFAHEGVFNFANQTVTDRVRRNIGLMLRERLTPPPEETYGLHRKLSGAFLLCSRLKAEVPCNELFKKIVG